MALRIPSTTLAKASSRFSHDVTGFMSVGKPCNLANGAARQSQARSRTGITVTFPALCLDRAYLISLPQQYSDARKSELIHKRITAAFDRLRSIAFFQSAPAVITPS